MAHHLYSVGSVVEKIKHHPKYYLNGGDIHFLVENILFRVHRYFFERESAWFREKLAVPAPAGQSPKGLTDTNAYPLEDVTADDFARFLWVFYNPKYSVYDATVDDWTAILKLAYDWRFGEVKKLCCRELEKFKIPPVRKIELYQTYDLDKKLLIPSYIALCMRTEPLSIKEGRQLGLETALLLATAREQARGKPSGSGIRSPSPVSAEDGDLVSIVTDVFGLTAGPPSPSLTPLENNTSASAFTSSNGFAKHSPSASLSASKPAFNTYTSYGSTSATAVNSVFGDTASPSAAVAAVDPASKDAAPATGQSSSSISPNVLNSRLISVFQMQGSEPERQVTQSKTPPQALGQPAPLIRTPTPKAKESQKSKEPVVALTPKQKKEKAENWKPKLKETMQEERRQEMKGRPVEAAGTKEGTGEGAKGGITSESQSVDDSTNTGAVNTPINAQSDVTYAADSSSTVNNQTQMPEGAESFNASATAMKAPDNSASTKGSGGDYGDASRGDKQTADVAQNERPDTSNNATRVEEVNSCKVGGGIGNTTHSPTQNESRGVSSANASTANRDSDSPPISSGTGEGNGKNEGSVKAETTDANGVDAQTADARAGAQEANGSESTPAVGISSESPNDSPPAGGPGGPGGAETQGPADQKTTPSSNNDTVDVHPGSADTRLDSSKTHNSSADGSGNTQTECASSGGDGIQIAEHVQSTKGSVAVESGNNQWEGQTDGTSGQTQATEESTATGGDNGASPQWDF
ncbi:hypothetical protein AcV7_001990 [Taiwanofungus camphoratus]|nr:hypothetical protein AcV7_001990 [Antrodia cinnamomea]